MRIAAFSDLHIGALDHADTFRHESGPFMRFLDALEEAHDRIVVVGDLYQTEHGLIPGRAGVLQQLREARERVGELGRRLERYVYVFGNHDWIARDVLGASETATIEADGFRVYFIHGHQFDPVLRRAYPAARLGTWITGRLRTHGLRPLGQWIEDRDIMIKHRRFQTEEGPYIRAATRLLREQSAHAVIMGHTHVAMIRELPEGIVANCGSCSRGRFVHLTIDTQERTVAIHRGEPERR